MKRLSLIAILVSAVALVANAQTEPTRPESTIVPSDKPLVPTVIEAENLQAEITEERGYLKLIGSVKLSGTNLEITCNQMEVFTDTKDTEGEDTIGDFSSIRRILATGNVKIVQEERTATAGKAEVLRDEEVIILDEDPIVYQDSIVMDGTGAQMIIERGNGTVKMIGDQTNKLRITGPPIEDFGFEENEAASIVPEETETIIPTDSEEEANDPDAGDANETEEEQGAANNNNRNRRQNRQ